MADSKHTDSLLLRFIAEEHSPVTYTQAPLLGLTSDTLHVAILLTSQPV